MTVVSHCPTCGNQHFEFRISAKDYLVTGESFNIINCPACGLLITSPRPPDEALNRYYQSEDYISHSSKATNLTNRLFLMARWFTLRKKLALVNKLSSKGKLLDFGCGTGDFLKVAIRNGWEGYGVEPSSEPGKIRDKGLNVSQALPEVGCEQFSSITLWHVLEHIPDLNEIVQQLIHKLSDLGTIFIAVPNYESYDSEFYGKYWAGYDVPRHLWHFNQNSMQKLLQKNSLRLIDIKPMKLDAFYVSLLSERYRSGNKTGITQYIKGFRSGILSNTKAMKSNQYSSLIYIARK